MDSQVNQEMTKPVAIVLPVLIAIAAIGSHSHTLTEIP